MLDHIRALGNWGTRSRKKAEVSQLSLLWWRRLGKGACKLPCSTFHRNGCFRPALPCSLISCIVSNEFLKEQSPPIWRIAQSKTEALEGFEVFGKFLRMSSKPMGSLFFVSSRYQLWDFLFHFRFCFYGFALLELGSHYVKPRLAWNSLYSSD